MTDRRNLLAAGVAENAAPPPPAGTILTHMSPAVTNKSAIPDVLVMTHEGRVARFHSELISDQVVLINFMSIAREEKFPISRKMARIAEALGPKLGKDVQIYSISTDPDSDTPEKLTEFHKQMGGFAGWTFVTAPRESTQMLATRFYRHGRDIALGGRTDIIQYGNAKVGLWGTFPWDVAVEDAATRVTWVMPREVAAGEMRRAGPRPLDAHGQRWNNRIA